MSGRSAACSRLLLRATAFRSTSCRQSWESATQGWRMSGACHRRWASLPPRSRYDRRRVNYSLQWRANGDSGGMYGGDGGSAARSALALPMPPSRVVWIARPMKQSCRGVGRVAQNARVRDGELVGVADAQAAFVRAI